MRRKVWTIPMVALVLAGCHSDKQTVPAPAADSVPTTPPPASAAEQARAAAATAARPELRPQTARIELGYSPSEDGAVVEGQKSRRFLAGATFVLAARGADLEAGTPISVHWKDASGQELGAETKRSSAGQAFVDFSNPDTTQWAAGTYRVDVAAGATTLGSLEFEIYRVGGSGG